MATLLVFIGGIFSPTFAYAYSNATSVTAYANDTVAGSTTVIKTSQVDSHGDIMLELSKPNGTVVKLPTTADAAGYGKLEINSFHLQSTGIYKIASYLPQYSKQVTYSSFEVFADKPSAALSDVAANKYAVEANGNDTVEITVTLKDQYGNPIKDHQVKLISSRSGDVITQPGGNMTSNRGQVIFRVSSLEEGIATISALNLTTNEILDKRVSVLYQGTKAMGGNESQAGSQRTSYFGASLLAQNTTSSGSTSNGSLAAAKIKITTIPTGEVKVGELFDVIIDVTTIDGQPALDYKGTITFTSDDTNAILPSDYTFTGGEQPAGRKIFAKAVRFLTEGTKIIEVKDKMDSTLKDVITVKNSTTGGNSTTSITILSPQDGIITSKEIPLSGTAGPSMNLKIFDNNDQIGQAVADASGNFQATLTSLTEGTHILSVKGYDTLGNVIAVSTPVSIVLRTSEAWVKSLTYDPAQATYTGGQIIKVILESEPELTEALYVLDNVKYTLLEEITTPGRYTGTITLPQTPASYDPQIQVKNKLGITGTVPSTSPLVITAPEFDVSSVNFALDGDSTVKATWTAPQSISGITSYRIYYSVSASTMSNYIPLLPTELEHSFVNLAPNTTYYFKFAVMGPNDAPIKEGDVKAITTPDTLQIKNAVATADIDKINVVWEMAASSTPITSFKVLYGVTPKQYIKAVTVEGKTTAVIDALASGKPHYIVIQGLGADGRPLLQSEEISATPMIGKPAPATTCIPGDVLNLRMVIKDKEKYLIWDSAYKAEKYRIHAGTEPGYYNLPAVEVTGTEYKVPTMDTKVQNYYFAVTALCGESESKNYSNALKVQSGPIAFFLFTAAGMGVWYYRGRKKQREVML
ncbi:MAG: Ig-like domain-containing protein [Candidatus Gracilibacteria bacterium]